MTDEGISAAELAALNAGAAGVAADELAPRRNGRRSARHKVEWDKTRKPAKPILPKAPDRQDVSDQCLWMTSVLNLDQSHPITGAIHQGLSGALGHVALTRLDAGDIRFEPASKINSSQKLNEELVWQLLPTDGDPYPWGNAQATIIARVVWSLCGTAKAATVAQETTHIISTFIDAAEMREGHTHGTSGQRAEFAKLLRPDDGPHHYGIDKDTGEFIVRVSDLQRVARDIMGGGIAYGWLDARMESIGWDRVRLDGHTLPDGPASQGEHVRADVYRGFLT